MIVAGVLLIVFAIYPFTIYPLILRLARRSNPVPRRSLNEWPSVSILCCCRNEAATIKAKVENTLAMMSAYPGSAEALFYLDACTDDTGDRLARFGSAVRVVSGATQQGKSVGMSILNQQAVGDILVFTDANTFASSDALVEFAREFSDERVGCVCAHLEYSNADEGSTAQVNSLYWQLEEALKRLETATGGTIAADGGLFALRRQHYRPTPPDVIDDMHTSMQALLDGSRIVASRDVRATERTTPVARDEFHRKIRIACRVFNCYRALAPRLHRTSAWMVFKFYSHKLVRYFSFPAGVGGLLLVLAGHALQGHLAAAAAIVGLTTATLLLGRMNAPIASSIYDVLMSHLAVSLGVLQSLRGQRYQMWNPLASGR